MTILKIKNSRIRLKINELLCRFFQHKFQKSPKAWRKLGVEKKIIIK